MTKTGLVEKKYIHICIFWLSIVFLNIPGSPIISICLVNYLHLVRSSVFGTMSGTYGQFYNFITAKGNSCTVENEFPLGDSNYISFGKKKKHSSTYSRFK